jgi:hypothetical protein
MALSTNDGTEGQPLATVVTGGSVTSTFLTLLVLPSVQPWLAGTNDDPEGQDYLASAIISMIASSTSCAMRAKAGESESDFNIADGFIMPIFVLPPSE